jgi:hypothetical protein
MHGNTMMNSSTQKNKKNRTFSSENNLIFGKEHSIHGGNDLNVPPRVLPWHVRKKIFYYNVF